MINVSLGLFGEFNLWKDSGEILLSYLNMKLYFNTFNVINILLMKLYFNTFNIINILFIIFICNKYIIKMILLIHIISDPLN